MKIIDPHGSFITTGPNGWSVLNARGSLAQRQETARRHGVQLFLEQHLNSIGGPKAETTNYAMCVVPTGAPSIGVQLAKRYTKSVAKEFGIKDAGVVYGGRGSGNVGRVLCPAVLLEPMFLSAKDFGASGEVVDALARILVESIKEFFPPGLVGLSVGHMYRGTGDKGANRPVYDPDELTDPAFDQEAEICDAIVNTATEMLIR